MKILYDLVFGDYWDIIMSTKLWSTSNELQVNEDDGRRGRCKQQTKVIDSIFKHNNLLLEHIISS
jgi:hypothetical protein